jgi:hypothetical protein
MLRSAVGAFARDQGDLVAACRRRGAELRVVHHTLRVVPRKTHLKVLGAVMSALGAPPVRPGLARTMRWNREAAHTGAHFADMTAIFATTSGA